MQNRDAQRSQTRLKICRFFKVFWRFEPLQNRVSWVRFLLPLPRKHRHIVGAFAFSGALSNPRPWVAWATAAGGGWRSWKAGAAVEKVAHLRMCQAFSGTANGRFLLPLPRKTAKTLRLAVFCCPFLWHTVSDSPFYADIEQYSHIEIPTILLFLNPSVRYITKRASISI